eukprot:1341345-Rhodomonas_salina.1
MHPVFRDEFEATNLRMCGNGSPAGVLLNLKVDQRLKDFLAGDGRSCDTLMRAPFHLCSWQVAVDPVHITHSASLVRPDAVHVLGAVHSELVLVEARRDGGKVCI